MLSKLETLLTQNDNPIHWDTYFASLCLLISSRSSCERLHVGCVLVNDKRILSTGYNGFLAGAPHKSIVRDNHEQATVHAEQNAISYAAKNGIRLENATAYITHYPCINCCKLLISSGIKTIYYLKDYKNDPLVAEFCQQVDVTCISLNYLFMI
jgi:dCMP deaminase